MLRRRWPVAVFAAWSGYVWSTRIANAWSATSDETTTAKVVSTVTAVVLLAGALAAVVILVRARARAFEAAESLVLRLAAGATVAVWAVRVPLIVADGGHDVPFKVVHGILGLLSVVLALATWRVAGREQDGGAEGGATGSGAAAVSPAANAGR